MTGRESRETLLGTIDGHTVTLSVTGPWVSIGWHGPAHADLTNEEARTLGYVLRGYARLADTGNDPS